MSPKDRRDGPGEYRFPRVSGDEPVSSVHRLPVSAFSPRERG